MSEVEIQPIREKSVKTPDYYITHLNALIEIKSVHDYKETKRMAQISAILNKLDKSLKDNPKSKSITGFYMVSLPPRITKLKDNDYKDFANQILNDISQGKTESEFRENKLEINLLNSESNDIIITQSPSGGFVDPALTIHENIRDLLSVANEQLSFNFKKEKPKKIILFENRYPFGDRIHEFVQALSYSYEFLLQMNNIDSIWVQNKRQMNYVHTLIYDRAFLQTYDKNTLEVSEKNKDLLQKWFVPLSRLGDNHQDKLFSVVRKFIQNHKASDIFPDKYVRQEIVKMGEWLISKKRIGESCWLIDRFIDDPDPEIPAEDNDENDNRYHNEIIEGKDISIITTVLGHLAWVIQKLTVHKEHIEKAFSYTLKLTKHNNLYVKLESLIPLIEISARRSWLDKASYKTFHKLVFDLLSNYGQYPAIAKRLCHVFYHFKEITSSEAVKVLNTLRISSESAPLFIYFSIFRKKHFSHQEPYDPSGPIKCMEDVIFQTTGNRNLQRSIAWQFWRILQNNRDVFDDLKQYVPLLLKGPHDGTIYQHIKSIIDEWFDREPSTCKVWTIELLRKVEEYSKLKGPQDFFESNKLFEHLANHAPETFVTCFKSILKSHQNGMYVGNIDGIINSTEQIKDPELKKSIQKDISLLKQPK
ncbi:hypothetical protein BVX98_02155 [bacterium F11]|nr:hypothetical protein BVX98_02155 [bacterium F11]